MTKDEIRQHIAELRPNFQTLEKLSAEIIKKFQPLEKQMGGGSASFQTLELFRQAKTLGVYMPLPDEVDISPLFPSFAKASEGRQTLEKTFYIPVFGEASQRPSTLRGGGYHLAELTPELKTGKFGIPEPVNPVFAPEELDLIIVPGVAFDRAGHRIGRGGGFYDRLLPQYRAVRVGICFDFQCLEKIPAEPHDCNVDLLVTESQILEFAMNC